MALSSPVQFDTAALRSSVESTYARLAREPRGAFHFHRGARYAAEYLGYDPLELAEVPQTATDRFAGVGNPLALGPVYQGETASPIS